MFQRALVLLVAGLVLPVSVSANKITKLDIWALEGYEEAPTVHVYSTNGEKWDAIDKSKAVKFKVRLNAECRFEGRGNKAYEGDMLVSGFEIIGDTDPAHFLIPHANTAEGTFRYGDGAGQPVNAVAICNTELTKRLSADADLTRYHIIGKGFTINYPGAYSVKYRMFCHATGIGRSDLGSDSTLVNARIKCEASDLAAQKIPKPKPKPKRAKLAALVKSASFVAEPATHRGKCPVGIRFKGSITSGRPGTVKYRYVSHDGRESPVFTLKFTRAESLATRDWSRTLSEPEAKAPTALAAPGAGGSRKDWDHDGWYRLIIVEPEMPGKIDAKYQVACMDPTPSRVLKAN